MGYWIGQPIQQKTLQLHTRKQRERQQIIGRKTLHEQMIYAVEDHIQYNWSDVAIHDKNRLDDAESGEAFAWIVSEFGSYLTPLFCHVEDESDEETFAPIQILFFRWLNASPFDKNDAYAKRYAPQNSRCFIVIKGDSDYDGVIHSVGYRELMDFVLLNLPSTYLDQ
jgi:hypothetical protein